MKRILVTAVLLLGGFVAGSAYAREGRNIVRWGNDVTVDAGTTVESAVAIGGNVTVNGIVTRDAVAIGGSVNLNPGSDIGDNAVAVGGRIIASTGSIVRGDVVEINAPGIDSTVRSLQRTNWWHVFWMTKLVMFVAFLALAVLVVAVMPRQTAAISFIIEEKFWYCLLWGIVGMLMIVPLAGILLLTIVGIVLIPVEIVAVVIAFVAGYIVVARVVGKKVFAVFHAPGKPMVLETLAGVIILALVGLIPFLGWLVNAVAWVAGFGGVIVAVFTYRKKPAPVPEKGI